MHVAIETKRWTLDELHSLPDDGNKYELVRGELFVTPAPTGQHESILAALSEDLENIQKGRSELADLRFSLLILNSCIFRTGEERGVCLAMRYEFDTPLLIEMRGLDYFFRVGEVKFDSSGNQDTAFRQLDNLFRALDALRLICQDKHQCFYEGIVFAYVTAPGAAAPPEYHLRPLRSVFHADGDDDRAAEEQLDYHPGVVDARLLHMRIKEPLKRPKPKGAKPPSTSGTVAVSSSSGKVAVSSSSGKVAVR